MAGSSSFLDKAKEIGLKARDAVAKNSEKIDDAVDKAADFVDTKTKGKYSEKVSKARTAAHDAVGKLDADDAPEADTDRPGPRPEPSDPGPTASDPGPTATAPPPPAPPPPPPPPAAPPEPPAAQPDPGLGDAPTAGPSDVTDGPPVAKPDPGAPGPD